MDMHACYDPLIENQSTRRSHHACQTILHQLLKHVCPTMHAARCKVLGVTVMAALRSRRLTVTDLGRAIQSRAKAKHCIKRADRLLANHRLYQERLALYGALSHWLPGPTTRPVILVDWSDLDAAKRHFLLRAAVPAGGRALTVYEEVHTVQHQGESQDPQDPFNTLAACPAARLAVRS